MNSDFDPKAFGRLDARVDALESKVDNVSNDVKELLRLADHSRGALWFGMSLVGTLGAAVGWLLSHWTQVFK